jgi:hypothetical protein
VLLLCFTAPLGKWLAQRARDTGVEVYTINGFAKERLGRAAGVPGAANLNDEEWRALCRPRNEPGCGESSSASGCP